MGTLQSVRVAAVAALAGLALACAGSAAAADGGSGTYLAIGSTFYFNLVNAGTTPWNYFELVGPPGTTFIGASTQGEITARCIAGQPDGLPNEIECGPLAGAGIQPNAHSAVVATLTSLAGCGQPFQLIVSSNAGASFTRATDATLTGGCAPALPTVVIPKAVTAPVVAGRPVVGVTLTAKAPSWNMTPTGVSYQWQLCSSARCTSIKGATRRTLKLTAPEAGLKVELVVTGAFNGDKVTSTSKKLAVRSS